MTQEKVLIYSCDYCCASIFESSAVKQRTTTDDSRVIYYTLLGRTHNFITDDENEIYCKCCKRLLGSIAFMRPHGPVALVSHVTPRTYIVSA